MAAKLVVLTMLCFCVCANAQTRPLVVYPGHSHTLDGIANHSLEQELKRVVAPAGIDLTWRSDADRTQTHQETGRIIVGDFAGNCSVETISNAQVASLAKLTLAEAPVSLGRVLPYFTVDCNRVIRTLAPMLQPLSPPMRQTIFGRALARVIAHEIYHILAETTGHEDAGLAKAKLTFHDLTAPGVELSPASIQRIRAAYRVQSPAVPLVGLISLDSQRR
jgi:hypothetical protein